jgi:hypothetical protein
MKNEYFEIYEKLSNIDKYDKKHFVRFEKEMEEIVSPLLNKWDKLSEQEIERLLKKFGNRIVRSEYSVFHKYLLSDNDFAEILLEIGNTYYNNDKILIEIVSAINNMFERYELKITDKIFQFIINQTNNKKVNFYVSIFISRLPQFNNYEYKWKYIMSVPNITPRDKSRNTFYHIINENINVIPEELKPKIITIFESYIEKFNLHPSTIIQYSAIIQKIRETYLM